MTSRQTPEFLRAGDMWFHGFKHKPWILLSSRKSVELGVTVWELTWFGCKGSSTPEIITDWWIDGSVFDVSTREPNE